LAPALVAEVRHDDAAERTCKITRREQAERLQLAQPLRRVGREEQLPDRLGEEHEDDEIVILERAAERREPERARVAAVQRTAVGNHASVGSHAVPLGRMAANDSAFAIVRESGPMRFGGSVGSVWRARLAIKRRRSPSRPQPGAQSGGMPSKKSTTPVSSEYSAPTISRPSSRIRRSMTCEP